MALKDKLVIMKEQMVNINKATEILRTKQKETLR
jgi:hypothetical protein